MPIPTASTIAEDDQPTSRNVEERGAARAASAGPVRERVLDPGPDERVRSVGAWLLDHWLEWLCLATAGVVMALVPLLDQSQRNAIYSTEQSVVERSSVVAWVLLAIAIPIVLRSISFKSVAASIVCLAAGAREAGLHSSITGYSVLKLPYYYRDEFPLAERAIVATIMLAFVASMVIVTIKVARAAYASGWYRDRWIRRLVAFAVLAPLSKVLDRAPDLLSKRGVELGPITIELFEAAEEVIELFLPVLLLSATIAYARRRRALRAQRLAAAS